MTKAKKKKKESPFITVRLRREVVYKVRTHKLETGVPVSTFIEKAVEKELNKI
jgi:predicted DNA binding CopG/RHH family protein